MVPNWRNFLLVLGHRRRRAKLETGRFYRRALGFSIGLENCVVHYRLVDSEGRCIKYLAQCNITEEQRQQDKNNPDWIVLWKTRSPREFERGLSDTHPDTEITSRDRMTQP